MKIDSTLENSLQTELDNIFELGGVDLYVLTLNGENITNDQEGQAKNYLNDVLFTSSYYATRTHMTT